MPLKRLLNHVQDIFSLHQGEFNGQYSINVYNCTEELIPHSEYFVSLTHEYLVEISFVGKISLATIIGKKLSRFMNKEVFLTEIDSNSIIYWFEGEEIHLDSITPKEKKAIYNTSYEEIARLKSETRLPVWLDKFIFDTLKAEYAPDFEKFDFNLELSDKDILTYLGTYFPRSYAESNCIFNDLLNKEYFRNEIAKKESINVLDIGCGTGGNLLGLLTALDKNLNNKPVIKIWALDGNSASLHVLIKTIDKFKQLSQARVERIPVDYRLDSIGKLKNVFQTFDCQSFDIIMSFKAVGEIISHAKGTTGQEYFDLTSLCCPLLSDSGIYLLLDVTTKSKYSNFLPILLNEQTRRYTALNSDFRILSPLPCNFYSTKCKVKCFYYHQFFVSHKGKRKDESRVVYKIIGRNKFVENFCKDSKIGKFVINWKRFEQDNETDGCCPLSINEVIICDSYKLS